MGACVSNENGGVEHRPSVSKSRKPRPTAIVPSHQSDAGQQGSLEENQPLSMPPISPPSHLVESHGDQCSEAGEGATHRFSLAGLVTLHGEGGSIAVPLASAVAVPTANHSQSRMHSSVQSSRNNQSTETDFAAFAAKVGGVYISGSSLSSRYHPQAPPAPHQPATAGGRRGSGLAMLSPPQQTNDGDCASTGIDSIAELFAQVREAHAQRLHTPAAVLVS